MNCYGSFYTNLSYRIIFLTGGRWKKGEKAAVLFMDVKGAFDHVSGKKLAERMTDLGLDGDLVGWTQSFIVDKKVELIIDGHINLEMAVNTGIPQDSPVFPILFLIYINGVFEEIKKKIL